mgnify:CR=1 FL=1
MNISNPNNDNDKVPHNLFNQFLTEEEYKFIKDLKEKNSKISFRDITPKVIRAFKRLEGFNQADIAVLYYTYYEKRWQMRDDIQKFFNEKGNQDELIEMLLDPDRYFRTHCYPFFLSRARERWTDSEINFLLRIADVVTDCSIFKYLALCFPGRNSQQVYSKYSELVKKGIIENDVRKIKPEEINNYPPIRRYFINDVEELLASEILVMCHEGRFISKETIRQKARDLYMKPWVLAERAAFQIFYMKRAQSRIYTNDECVAYTEEFLDCVQNLQNQMLPEGEVEAIPEAQIRLIEWLKLPEAKFSNAWVQAFMKRNHFSFRLAHYSRRGSINQKHVNAFLEQLAAAVVKYTWQNVYNMDETSVRINNSKMRAIAPIGTEKVIIDGVKNEKECFTSIGTINRYDKFPLIILGKGKTQACLTKFRAADKAELWPSKNGWVDEEVMLKYLEWLSENVAEGKPCALVLDCYRAHRTDNVKEKAKDLNIELIFVPASGTSLFQPLDRRIFGILKSNLRLLAGTNIYNGPTRYATITQHLLTAWSRISKRALKSGWKIPGLIEELEKNGYEDDDELQDEEEDEEDKKEEELLKEDNEEMDEVNAFFEEEEYDEEDENYEDKYY